MSKRQHDQENARFGSECRYLALLIDTGGNASVPRGAVKSYFSTQSAVAKKHRFYALHATLEWILGNWDDRWLDGEFADPEEDPRPMLLAHAAALSGPDVSVCDHGTLVTFLPLSQEARDWFNEHVAYESHNLIGDRVAVEHRYAEAILEGLVDADFHIYREI